MMHGKDCLAANTRKIKQDMSCISVIIPVYNVENYFHRCVNSVIYQTMSSFQLILIDDGSPDNCSELCDGCADSDDRIIVIHQKNGGLSAARNAGIDWVINSKSTDWIFFLDSDDWIHPQCLELLQQVADKTEKSVVVTDFAVVDHFESSKIISVPHFNCIKTDEFFLDTKLHPVSACGRLFRTEDFCNIRFPNGKIHEDRFTTYKILFKYEDITFVSNEMYYCFENAASITRKCWSPGRLDDIEAIEQQLYYFSRLYGKNCPIYDFLIHEYISLLIYSLKQAKKNKRYNGITYMIKFKILFAVVVGLRKVKLTQKEKDDLLKYGLPLSFRLRRYFRMFIRSDKRKIT